MTKQGYFDQSPMDKAVGRVGTWVSNPMQVFAPTSVHDHPAFKAIMALSAADRLEVLLQFCRGCGINDPGCQCENDE